MNLCFISYRENNPYIGGIEKTTYTIGRELKRRGHEILFISQINSHTYKKYEPICNELFFPDSECIESDINIRFLLKIIERNCINIIINQYSTTDGFNTICNVVRKKKPHIRIITPLHLDPFHKIKEISENFFINKKNGKNIYLWLKDLLLYTKFKIFKQKKIQQEMKRRLEYIERCSDKVILLSDNFKKEIEDSISTFTSYKYYSIPNPIECIDKTEYNKKKQILYVGRIEYGLKRFDRILDIWHKIEQQNPEWQLIVLGDGDYRGHFEQIARQLGLTRILFEGFKDPIPYYEESEIICLTSSSEGFANVLVEAQNYGCIPIAFDSYSALKDIIIDGYNGYTIPAFKNNLFANKIQGLINNPRTRREMQDNAKKYSKKFDIKFVADQWEKLFKELTKKE